MDMILGARRWLSLVRALPRPVHLPMACGAPIGRDTLTVPTTGFPQRKTRRGDAARRP